MDAARTWPLWMAGALPNAPAKLSQSSTLCVPGSRTSGCRLGCFCRWRNLSRGYRFGRLFRLFRLFRLRLQRQNARDSVLVRVNALLVLLDPEPDARRLEQENLGVVHLFVDTKHDAQILQGLAADRLCLFVGMHEDDPLPDQASLEFSFGNLPREHEVISVTGLWL